MNIQDPVIFLDIDGVLNSHTSKSFCGRFIGIDKDKTQRLATIVKETNATIVLSSTWRLDWIPNHPYYESIDIYELAYVGKYLRNHLWKKGRLVAEDKTPHLNFDRADEIYTYLNQHPNIKNYVILDDEFFRGFEHPKLLKHLVLTDAAVGLTDKDVSNAIQILKGQLNEDIEPTAAFTLFKQKGPNFLRR